MVFACLNVVFGAGVSSVAAGNLKLAGGQKRLLLTGLGLVPMEQATLAAFPGQPAGSLVGAGCLSTGANRPVDVS